MTVSSLRQLCIKSLYENYDNMDDIYGNESVPGNVKKDILNTVGKATGTWYCSEKKSNGFGNGFTISYNFNKHQEFNNPELKIYEISVTLDYFKASQKLGGRDRQTLGVSLHTWKSDVFLDIIQKAQEVNKTKYVFHSYGHFPQDSNGLCTIEAVQSLRSRDSVLFDLMNLEVGLKHYSNFKTQEELIEKINAILAILLQSDSSTEAVTKYLSLDFKV